MVVQQTKSIHLSWQGVKEEFEWLTVYSGESLVRSYLIRHSGLIDSNLEFLGVELGALDRSKKIKNGSPKMAFSGVLYRKEGTNEYYLVETKESTKNEASGRKEAEVNARCLDEYFSGKGIDANVTPVFVGIEFPSKKPMVGADI